MSGASVPPRPLHPSTLALQKSVDELEQGMATRDEKQRSLIALERRVAELERRVERMSR